MKKIGAIIALTIALAAFSSCTGDGRRISVSGTGEITFVPDMISFNVMVKKVNPRLADSSAQVRDTMKRVLAVCADFKVPDEDIKSGFVNAGKEYSYDRFGNRIFAGFFALQSTRITFRDITRFEDFTGGLLELRVDSIDGLSFSHSKLADYQSQADLLALDKAKVSAGEIAARMGQRLGSVEYISNNGMRDHWDWDVESSGLLETRSKSRGAGIVISPGIISITRTVDAVFELR